MTEMSDIITREDFRDMDGVERNIRQLRQGYVRAVNVRDPEGAAACWAPGMRILIENRDEIQGARALEFVRRMIGSSHIARFAAETVVIEHSGNLAYEVGRYSVALRMPDGSEYEERGKYLDVWKKFGRSDWRILVHAPSSDPRQ